MLLSLVAILTGGDQQAEVPVFESVYLAFSEEHSQSLVSGFGHLFVCLPTREVSNVDDLLGSTALNFGADTSRLGKGMWVGEYKLQTCHQLIRKNTRFDQRTLTFFKLEVSSSELAKLRSDLQVRLTQSYPYDFFRHNCAHYLSQWLESDAPTSVALLYRTPREALTSILQSRPPLEVWTLRSDIEILEDYIGAKDEELYQDVRNAINYPRQLSEIDDLEARLLAIQVAESRSGPDDYAFLQQLRKETLTQQGGPEAARRTIARKNDLTLEDRGDWKVNGEGPHVSVGAVFRDDYQQAGARFSLAAGLRDNFTHPVARNGLRDVKFLGVTVDAFEDETDFGVVLASVSNTRDYGGLLQGTSSGFSVGYTELPNHIGYSGAYVDTWAGLSTQVQGSWVGARIGLVGDELFTDPRLTALGGLTWDASFHSHETHVELNVFDAGRAGWALKYSYPLSLTYSVGADWTRSPTEADILSIALRIRL